MKEYNIEVVGSEGVGKSSFTIRLVQGIFVKNYDPTRQDLYSKKVIEQVDDHTQHHYTVHILDTVGVRPETKDNPELQDTKYLFGQGFIVMYDLTREETFGEALSIIRDILAVKKDKKTPIMLLANKLDMEGERQVLRSTAVEEVDKLGNCNFAEISVLEDTEVIASLQTLAKAVDKKSGGVVPKENESSCAIS